MSAKIAAFTVLILVTSFSPRHSLACSLGRAAINFSETRVVLLGRISAHIGLENSDRPEFGFTINPIRVFSRPDVGLELPLTILPNALGMDCGLAALYPTLDNLETYAIGKLVVIHASPIDSEYPSVIDALLGYNLEIPDESCSLESIGTPQDTWPPNQRCGSMYFRAQAFVAALPDASAQNTFESLQHLANYPAWIRFKELVQQFVLDETRQQELMELRYGSLTYDSCLDDTDSAVGNQQEQHRRTEFCESSRHEWAR